MSPKDITVPHLRHPEKAHKADNAQPKKPDTVDVPTSVAEIVKDVWVDQPVFEELSAI